MRSPGAGFIDIHRDADPLVLDLPAGYRTSAVRASVGEPLRFHDLRHSHVAMLISQGEHAKAIQARLGHASICTTLDTYGHLFDGHDEARADRLDEVMTNRDVGLAWGRATRAHTGSIPGTAQPQEIPGVACVGARGCEPLTSSASRQIGRSSEPQEAQGMPAGRLDSVGLPVGWLGLVGDGVGWWWCTSFVPTA